MSEHCARCTVLEQAALRQAEIILRQASKITRVEELAAGIEVRGCSLADPFLSGVSLALSTATRKALEET